MIIFSNKGAMDVRSITTFGVSAKSSSSAIGFFGTGLKYAIAVILRTGGKIWIVSGNDKYEFDTETDSIRGKEFQFIRMTKNGENTQTLGFTTELGKTWERWQAFRELYCNCTDEGGTPVMKAAGIMDATQMTGDNTHVFVTGMDDVWEERNNIFLYSDPIYQTPEVDIHEGHSQYIYFKGVRVHELSQYSQYTYNLKGADVSLTEDRTLNHAHYESTIRIARNIAECSDIGIIRDILLAGGHERNFDYKQSNRKPSAQFKQTVQSLKNQKIEFNQSAYGLVIKTSELSETHPEMALDELDTKRLDKAILFCKDMGMDMTKYPIKIYESLREEGIMGEADMINKKILLSKLAFTMGTKQLVSTLVEEYVHLAHGHQDMSRGMQNFLFDSWISLAERHYRNPL
jgi:hypothetical protein